MAVNSDDTARKEASGSTVYHVRLGDDEHYYFGSVAAIYDRFTPEQLGVSKFRLWAFGITPGHPYRNRRCTVYRGEIYRKKGNRRHPGATMPAIGLARRGVK